MPLIKTPVFRPDLHVESIAEEGLFLLSESELTMLSGAAYAKAAEIIDGIRSFDEVAMQLARAQSNISLPEAYFIVESLVSKGLVQEANANSDALSLAFGFTENATHPMTVSVESLSAHTEIFMDALNASSLQVSADAPLRIVLVDSYLDRRLEAINRAQLQSGQAWMLVKMAGHILWTGPIFVPGKTGCYACLAQRMRANREVETFLEGRNPERDFMPLSKTGIPSTYSLAANMAVTEALRWLHQPSASPLQGAVVTFQTQDHGTQRHILIRRPQCECCGNPEEYGKLPEKLVLHSHPKKFTEDGGHRVATPEETFAKYAEHISPVTGIVNNLSRLTPQTNLIHSYHAGHNTAAHYQSLMALQRGLRSKAGGKGKTDIQAKVSGLCEAVERYSGVFQGYEHRIRSSYKALGDKAIHPNACTHYSPHQYENREFWNKYAGGFHTVPMQLDETAEIDWSPVWSLTHGTYKYLPSAYLYYNYMRDGHEFFVWADSNGNASGNTLEEAILQGFFELVERDAVAIWWYNRLQMPGVDLSTFEDPWIDQLLKHYKTLNREVWVLDLTNDLGIPVFGALTRRTDKPAEDIIVGFGAHFDPKLALLRALTEINQFMPAVMDVPAEGPANYRFDDPHILQWWQNATIANQPYLLPDANVSHHKRTDYKVIQNQDLLDDVLACKQIVESKGLEMLVQVQTRPDIGMPVAKVIVPGLRHFWARFGEGRLYEVPVAMGWLEQPLREEELNPIPMFI